MYFVQRDMQIVRIVMLMLLGLMYWIVEVVVVNRQYYLEAFAEYL